VHTQIARCVIAFSWLYHGIFPKLITIAPLELEMTRSIGLTADATYWLIKSAGGAEVIFGVLFFCFYKKRFMNYLNIAGLIMLLILVAIQMPNLLIEAFNPVTTNIPIIALSFILLSDKSLSRHHPAFK
jgi:uncharacterized membrane protein YphA (DoxX/SURF4 family)